MQNTTIFGAVPLFHLKISKISHLTSPLYPLNPDTVQTEVRISVITLEDLSGDLQRDEAA